MSNPDIVLLPDGTPAGWWVKDPDGNVVQSGPAIDLVSLADFGSSDTPTEGS